MHEFKTTDDSSLNKILFDLAEAKVEHRIEIQYIKQSMERIFDEIKNINSRLSKIEIFFEIDKETSKRNNRFSFAETVSEYKHIIAFIVAVAICFFSWVFGIKD